MKNYYEIQFELENMCYLDCLHCSSLEMRKHKTLCYSLSDMKNLINLCPDHLYIKLTGGEPLLYKNLNNLLDEINKFKNIDLGIFTCGILNKNNELAPISLEEAQIKNSKGLKQCYISIYSTDEKDHDLITNLPGSLKHTKESIANLKKANIDVKVHLVINKLNINKLNNIINDLGSWGVSEVRILKLVNIGNATINWKSIGVSGELQDKAIEQLFKIKNNFESKVTFSGFPEMTGCRPYKGSIGCQAGTNLLYVTIDGDIYPCACTKGSDKHKIGNISEINLVEKYIKENSKLEYHSSCLNKK